jgi:hypothetical protein
MVCWYSSLLTREPPIFKQIDRRQGREERLESLCLSSCEQDSGIGSHGATWAPANLGEQRTSRIVSSRARSPCAHEAASGASSGNHAHGGRTSAESGGGLDADGLSLECSSPTSGRALDCGSCAPSLYPRLTILLWSGSCVGTRMCAPSWDDWRAVC